MSGSREPVIGSVIGIVGHGYLVPRGPALLRVTGTPRDYADRIVAAGARPVVLPAGHVLDLLDLVDALVLTGGADLGVDPERDSEELAVVREAARRRIPLLGVCRGLQVLVVAFGGTLVADLGSSHRLPETGHPVRCTAGSLAGSLLGPAPTVTSLHHQSVADPGPSWRVTARAGDGVVEAAEWAGPGAWDVLGVQWHPELSMDGTGERVFGWLVEVARQRPAVSSAGILVG